MGVDGSPVSDGGRGLKLQVAHQSHRPLVGSPVSDGGRGLKLVGGVENVSLIEVRPSAMAGVD